MNYHGLRLTDDGRPLYVANIGNPTSGELASGGLRILDVSQIQARERRPAGDGALRPGLAGALDPAGRPSRSPATGTTTSSSSTSTPTTRPPTVTDPGRSPVGAARIIDIDDPRHPKVVSNIRLKVHQPQRAQRRPDRTTRARSPVQGYAGHYCSVPKRTTPTSSLLDDPVRPADLRHPRRAPTRRRSATSTSRSQGDNPTTRARGAFAMSQPAWDPRRSVWYSDGNTGFYVVRLTNGLQGCSEVTRPGQTKRAKSPRTARCASYRRAHGQDDHRARNEGETMQYREVPWSVDHMHYPEAGPGPARPRPAHRWLHGARRRHRPHPDPAVGRPRRDDGGRDQRLPPHPGDAGAHRAQQRLPGRDQAALGDAPEVAGADAEGTPAHRRRVRDDSPRGTRTLRRDRDRTARAGPGPAPGARARGQARAARPRSS